MNFWRSVAPLPPASRRVAVFSLLASAAAFACSAPPGVGDEDDGVPSFSGLPGGGAGNGVAGAGPLANGSGGSGASPLGNAGSGSLPVGGSGNVGGSGSGSAGSGNGNVGGSGSGAAGSGNVGGSGTAGSGSGTAGSGSGSAGTGGDVTLPDPPGEAFFFDDFEAGTPGQQPQAWDSWINYSVEAGNTPGGQQFALLDDQDCLRGNQCVHFHAEGATQPAMLTFPLPANMTRVYVRAFLKTSKQVGNQQPDAVSNHETLIALRATPNSGEFEIRFGGAKGALGFNIVGPNRNDAVAPGQALWGSAPAITANEWHCVEIAFINDNPASPQAVASVDGTQVRSVAAVSDWHIGLTQNWLNDMFVEVALGWQSFSPNPGNDVWMDDVVLSQSPIGCN